MIPSAKYAKSHEYANVEGDIATIGISDFAQVRIEPFSTRSYLFIDFSASRLFDVALF